MVCHVVPQKVAVNKYLGEGMELKGKEKKIAHQF
jgi:hypothetical protein